MPKVNNIVPRIIFKDRPDKKNEGYLYFIVRHKGKVISHSLNGYLEKKIIKRKEWNSELGLLGTKFTANKYRGDNNKISSLLTHFEEWFKDNDFNKDYIKKELVRFLNPNYSLDEKHRIYIIDFLEYYYTEQSKKENINKETIRKIKTCVYNLKLFSDEVGKNYKFNQIDWMFRDEFVKWMYAEPRKFSANHAMAMMQKIKEGMSESMKLGFHSNTIHKENGFGVKKMKHEHKVTFSFDELKKITDYPLVYENEKRVRDLLLIGCYTGLRFSDWHKVSEAIEEKRGVKMLRIQTSKTKQVVIIPVLDELDKVLKRGNYVVPKMGISNFNTYIKRVIKQIFPNKEIRVNYSESGLKKEKIVKKYKAITSHCCRRSFATNFYKTGVPPYLLMQITGHTTEKQFFNYIGVSKEEQAMKFFDIVKSKSK